MQNPNYASLMIIHYVFIEFYLKKSEKICHYRYKNVYLFFIISTS